MRRIDSGTQYHPNIGKFDYVIFEHNNHIIEIAHSDKDFMVAVDRKDNILNVIPEIAILWVLKKIDVI